jgi:tripartite-type tricarboxylate transporter receptor subunit TctC
MKRYHRREEEHDMPASLRWLCAILIAASAWNAAAQNYPSQPIRLIAPFPPGGSVDITARLIAEPLAAQLGQRIIVDNRSGASGNIGMEAAARAAPDGYTLVLNTIPLVTNQAMFPNLTWDPIRDFTAIGMVSTSPHVVVVPGKSPITSIDQLVKTARSSPGKLSYASAGVGTTFHLCAELFKDQTQTFILHVPYRGGGPAVLDTLAAQVDLSFPTLAAAVPHVRSGALRALAVTSVRRSPLMPDVPTLQEAGLKDFQFSQWQAVLAPAKTPPAIVARLNAALNEVLRSKEVAEKFQAQAFDPLITSPEEAGRYIAEEAKRLSRVIKTKGITAD